MMSAQGVLSEALTLIQSAPPTWKSTVFSNLLIFIAGSPILVVSLSASSNGEAFLLGTLTWCAFGSSGFLLIATYFVVVIDDKNALGAEQVRAVDAIDYRSSPGQGQEQRDVQITHQIRPKGDDSTLSGSVLAEAAAAVQSTLQSAKDVITGK